MFKYLVSICLIIVLNACSKKEAAVVPANKTPTVIVDPIPLSLVGNWELGLVYTYKIPVGKNPINVTYSPLSKTSYINLKSDGNVEYKVIEFATTGFNINTILNLTGKYSIDKDQLKLSYVVNGKTLVNYFKVIAKDDNRMELFQDKNHFLKSIEENKASLELKDYNNAKSEYATLSNLESSSLFRK